MYTEVAGLISCSSKVIAKIWLDPLRGFWDRWTTFINSYFQKIYSFMPFFYLLRKVFGLLTASIPSPVKNNYKHVTMGGILNKIIKIKFSVRCMVWLWCRLFQVPQPLNILTRLFYSQTWLEGTFWSPQKSSLKSKSPYFKHLTKVPYRV